MIQYERIALYYSRQNKKAPFKSWFDSLDPKTKGRIRRRLERLYKGNLGDYKRVNSELIELRMHFGPGYRVYGTITSNKTLVLLCGGTKAEQQRDIERAMQYCKLTDNGWYYEL